MIALAPKYKRTQVDPDADLMLQVGAGDTAAFDQLVEKYYDRVLSVIYHLMGPATNADDLAQEVFLRVYRARENYRPESKFSTWLFVIVNNVVRNARRTLARRKEVQSPLELAQRQLPMDLLREDKRESNPLEATVRGELRDVVREAVRDLNSRQQTAITLYHFRGMSYAEVADSMDTSLSAAKALLHRARLTLRGRLNAYTCS